MQSGSDILSKTFWVSQKVSESALRTLLSISVTMLMRSGTPKKGMKSFQFLRKNIKATKKRIFQFTESVQSALLTICLVKKTSLAGFLGCPAQST